ncbi:hypothetical protein [Massilia sp. CCM 8734]|uniref:hypothetical protein n=1 Tax=Massilia sp. CCM 8734 TaxID=2609283 RepID=UPI0014233B7A|nr:hypothetical protein [Massilia sp. CCM 8734]
MQNQLTGTSIVYRQKLPRILRWNEGAVMIAQLHGTILVSGPRFIVGWLRKDLVKAAPTCVIENVSS